MVGQPGDEGVRVLAQQAEDLGVDGHLRRGGAEDEGADLVGPGERRGDRHQRAQRVADQHRRAEAERPREAADGVAVALEA